jgi:large subunit ribosomal protein L30
MPEGQSTSAGGQISIKQVRSGIGSKPKARGALRALGLGGIGRTHVLPDRPEIRGMLAGVRHLVEVTAVDGAAVTGPKPARPARGKGAPK